MAEYSNRSDLQNAATRQVRFTGQTYGEGAAQQASQAAVSPGSAPSTVQAQQMAAQQRPRPGAQPLLRPSERPNEPITAGANFGPGPNALQAGIRPRFIQEDDVQQRLIQLYMKYPNEGLRRLLQRYTDMMV